MTHVVVTFLATTTTRVPDNTVGTGLLLGAVILGTGLVLRVLKNRKK